MEHLVSKCLWPSLITWQNIQDILLGNTMIFFSLLNGFFFLIFPLRMHNWCSVYQFDLIWFAFLCSSWTFQDYRTSGYRELVGPTTTKERTRVCSTDQWAAMSLAMPVLAQVYFALFQHCRPPHILPELWKFKTDSWVCQAWRARIRNAEIFTHPGHLSISGYNSRF